MLADGDLKLTESNVVVEYLDAAYPESGARLIPTDARNLAQVFAFYRSFGLLNGSGASLLSLSVQAASVTSPSLKRLRVASFRICPGHAGEGLAASAWAWKADGD